VTESLGGKRRNSQKEKTELSPQPKNNIGYRSERTFHKKEGGGRGPVKGRATREPRANREVPVKDGRQSHSGGRIGGPQQGSAATNSAGIGHLERASGGGRTTRTKGRSRYRKGKRNHLGFSFSEVSSPWEAGKINSLGHQADLRGDEQG